MPLVADLHAPAADVTRAVVLASRGPACELNAEQRRAILERVAAAAAELLRTQHHPWG